MSPKRIVPVKQQLPGTSSIDCTKPISLKRPVPVKKQLPAASSSDELSDKGSDEVEEEQESRESESAVKELLPAASSSEELSDEGSGEEEEEEQEPRKSESKSDNQEKQNEKNPLQPTPAPPQPRKSQRGSSSTRPGYEYENEAPSLKKSKTVPSTSLKQVEMDELGHTKNMALLERGEESKKPAFQRIWDDDDEITLLQVIIDYHEKGMDPFKNAKAFYNHVKGLLGRDFTDSQLANKVRVFKKKYRNNKGKGMAGEDRVFLNSHDQQIFELSKKIWDVAKHGDAVAGGTEEIGATAEKKKTFGANKFVASPKSKSEASKSNDAWEHIDDILQMSRTGLDVGYLKKGMELLEDSKRAELKERWSKLHFVEMQVVAERCQLINDQINIILEAYSQFIEK